MAMGEVMGISSKCKELGEIGDLESEVGKKPRSAPHSATREMTCRQIRQGCIISLTLPFALPILTCQSGDSRVSLQLH